MSIYSGFATRNLEQTYDQYLCDLLFVLQKRILKFYQNEETDQDKFWTILSQLYHQVLHLQKSKYLEPKSSYFVVEIYEYLKLKKQERNQDPQEDLKKFQRSMALKVKKQQEQIKIKEPQLNNFIRGSTFSFGKIKKQLEPGRNVIFSVQSISRKGEVANESFDSELKVKLMNPEQINRRREKRVFSSKGIRNAKSFHEQISQNLNEGKIKISGSSTAEQVVKQYLQKTNKNYLRGYRKRKIRDDFVSENGNKTDLKNFTRQRLSGR